MMFELPDIYKSTVGYYQGVSLILWIIVIILLLLSFLLFIRETTKVEIKSAKMVFLAYGVFYLFFAITRIMYITGYYVPQSYDFFTTLGYIFFIIPFIFWLYVLETYVITSTKKIFTIINTIVFVIALIALLGATTRYIAVTIMYILLPISGIVLIGIYIYLIINTRGIARKKALGVLVGLVLLIISHLMDSEFFLSAFPTFPLEVAPLIMIAGVIIFTSSQIYLKASE